MSNIPFIKTTGNGGNRGYNRGNNFPRTYRTNYNKPVSAREQVPEHYRKLVYILRSNAHVSRYTSFGIINYLKQVKIIPASIDKVYVKFLWNKFTVRFDNRAIDYPYTEQFFIAALLASFNAFVNVNLNTIQVFLNETLGKSVNDLTNNEEINNLSNEVINMANNDDKENPIEDEPEE